MQQKEITLSFDLDVEEEKRVYEALINLSEFYKLDRSKALIRFINNLVAGIAECEERKNKCEGILKTLVGSVPRGKKIWN
jgi:pantothenate kinase